MAIPDAGLIVEVWNHDGIVLLDLSGELTATETPALLDADETVIRRSAGNLQLGLRHVTFIDSAGLEALIQARERATTAELPMQLLGLSVRVRRLLEITGLKGLFDVIE